MTILVVTRTLSLRWGVVGSGKSKQNTSYEEKLNKGYKYIKHRHKLIL